MLKFLKLVCTKCGSNLEVPQDTERTHCSFCGNEMVVGVKSARGVYHFEEKIFCTDCGKELVSTKGDLIFHCTICNEPVCEACCTVRAEKRYCRKCN